MRKILLILIAGIILSCSSNKYLLTDKNQDKKYLVDFIKALKNQGRITGKPLLLIDDSLISSKSLKANQVPLSKADIFKIEYVTKNSPSSIKIYGKRGKKGALYIITKKSQERLQEQPTKSYTDSKILFLLGNQQITREELQKIAPNDIESIEIIKAKNAISKFTSENYDGVVIITMKKKK